MLIRSVLFNFQGASQSALSGDFVIISHSFKLVKYFFKISFDFFLEAFKKRLSLRKLNYYITFILVCQEVFQNFLKNFRDFLLSFATFATA